MYNRNVFAETAPDTNAPENFLGIGKKSKAKREDRRKFVIQKIQLRNAPKLELAQHGIAPKSGLNDALGGIAGIVGSVFGRNPAISDTPGSDMGAMALQNSGLGTYNNNNPGNASMVAGVPQGNGNMFGDTGGGQQQQATGTDIKKYLPYILAAAALFFFMRKK